MRLSQLLGPACHHALALLLAMALAAPAWARTVKIETAVPLSDDAPESLEKAFTEALDTTVRGAVAMGFSWIRLDGARVLEHSAVVRMVATDDESEDIPEEDPPGTSAPPDPCLDGF